jgi:hypothetical protein
MGYKNKQQGSERPAAYGKKLFLLVTVLSKSLFAFVGCNFVTFSLFSARHSLGFSFCWWPSHLIV